jgi:hypothetical protein
MSYVAGYAWMAVLLALLLRWDLTSPTASVGRGALWGWICGVSGLFYFTHVAALAVLWLQGLGRTPWRALLVTTFAALAVPFSWELAGRALTTLQFDSGTAVDLTTNLAGLLRTALADPLSLPAEAGQGTTRALLGGFPFPLLPLAALGAATAPRSRRTWYLTVALCGLAPAMILHHLPATQRYGYLAFPAIALAAAEGLGWLALGRRPLSVSPPPVPVEPSLTARWVMASVLILGAVALFQANADLWGRYDFALAFGAP